MVFFTATAQVVLRANIINGSVAGGTGTTVLLGRNMKIIRSNAKIYNYATLKIPTFMTNYSRPLSMAYNKAWVKYHINAGSQILFHINTRVTYPLSQHMQMEIRTVNEMLKF